jgi:hypothetical protein
VAIQVVNEGIDELYTASREGNAERAGEKHAGAGANTRAYSLATGMVQMRWPMIDKTNTQFIEPIPRRL